MPRAAEGRAEEALAVEIHARFTYRMHDLGHYMKTLLGRYTQWFNHTHQRTGTLWEGRFKSVLVEEGVAARAMAAYLDLFSHTDIELCGLGSRKFTGLCHKPRGLRRLGHPSWHEGCPRNPVSNLTKCGARHGQQAAQHRGGADQQTNRPGFCMAKLP